MARYRPCDYSPHATSRLGFTQQLEVISDSDRDNGQANVENKEKENMR